MSASQIIVDMANKTVANVTKEVQARAYQASNELRTASLYVLRGQRSGRVYRIPHTKKTYQASAPGEPPAVRTGVFRLSWAPKITTTENGVIAAIESDVMVGKYNLGNLLEGGTKKMAPRPYKEAVKARALPKILAIYKQPYNI